MEEEKEGWWWWWWRWRCWCWWRNILISFAFHWQTGGVNHKWHDAVLKQQTHAGGGVRPKLSLKQIPGQLLVKTRYNNSTGTVSMYVGAAWGLLITTVKQQRELLDDVMKWADISFTYKVTLLRCQSRHLSSRPASLWRIIWWFPGNHRNRECEVMCTQLHAHSMWHRCS